MDYRVFFLIQSYWLFMNSTNSSSRRLHYLFQPTSSTYKTLRDFHCLCEIFIIRTRILLAKYASELDSTFSKRQVQSDRLSSKYWGGRVGSNTPSVSGIHTHSSDASMYRSSFNYLYRYATLNSKAFFWWLILLQHAQIIISGYRHKSLLYSLPTFVGWNSWRL